MPVFRGARWQRGYGQMGYGLGALLKRGAKSLGKVALRKGIGMLSDYLAQQGIDTSGISQTGQGQRRGRKAKKRKACGSKGRRQQTKRRKTSSCGHLWLKNMSFVHSSSEECTKSELDLFSITPTQVTLEKGHWVDHLPVSSAAEGGSITFLCPGTEDYVDLAKTIWVVRAKVTKANGDDLDADERLGVVNNFLHSLFKQVDVFLKEKQVMQAAGTYAYRTYLETLLNYGPAAKESQLTSGMFYKDTAGKMNAPPFVHCQFVFCVY